MSEQVPTNFSHEEILIIAEQVYAGITESPWSEVDEDEQEYYQERAKQILAALQSDPVLEAIAKYVHDHEPEGNMPTTYDAASPLVQTNYYNEAFAVVEHLLQNRTFDVDGYKQRTSSQVTSKGK